MPIPIKWYVRTALLHMALAMMLGVLYQYDRWRHTLGLDPYVLVMHTHLALMGGVIQMIMGVGLWMFPSTQPLERRLAWRPGLAWLTYGLFNGGLLGRFGAEYAYRATGRDVFGALTVLTGLMQLGAVLLFGYHAWRLRIARRARARV
jgi:hypothetical protein